MGNLKKKSRKLRGRSRSRDKVGDRPYDEGRRHGRRRASHDAKGGKRGRDEGPRRAESEGGPRRRRRLPGRRESRHYTERSAADSARQERARSGQLSVDKLRLSPAKDGKKAVKFWGQKPRRERRRREPEDKDRASLRSAADARRGGTGANSVAVDKSRCLERLKNGQLASGQGLRDLESSPSSRPRARDRSLPPGWQGIRDAETGDMYYWHKDDPNNTTWERPVNSRPARSFSRSARAVRCQGSASPADARATLKPRSGERTLSPGPSQSSGSSLDGSLEDMPEPSDWDAEETARFLEALGLSSAASAAREAPEASSRGFVSCVALGEAVRELLAAEDTERRHARRAYFRLMVSREAS